MKKIIIDGKEMSIKEAIHTKIYYRAMRILEPAAREIAENARDEKYDFMDIFTSLDDEIETLFLRTYLENAKNDLVINTDEIADLERKEEEERKASLARQWREASL